MIALDLSVEDLALACDGCLSEAASVGPVLALGGRGAEVSQRGRRLMVLFHEAALSLLTRRGLPANDERYVEGP